MKFILIYFLFINILTFIVFGVDKYKAIYNRRRISEKTLLFLVSLGGFVGGLLGMIFFSHKTVKSSFQIKFYIILFIWLILLILGLLKL